LWNYKRKQIPQAGKTAFGMTKQKQIPQAGRMVFGMTKQEQVPQGGRMAFGMTKQKQVPQAGKTAFGMTKQEGGKNQVLWRWRGYRASLDRTAEGGCPHKNRCEG
jgi:hypothetical protein